MLKSRHKSHKVQPVMAVAALPSKGMNVNLIIRRFAVKLCLAAPLAGALLLAVASAAPASAALARPAVARVITSQSNCNNNPLEFVEECTSVNGSGLHINSLSGVAHNLTIPIPNVHIELYGPRGLIKNCPAQLLFLTSPTCTWSPNANEPAGDYCSAAWEAPTSPGSTYKELNVECVGVHA